MERNHYYQLMLGSLAAQDPENKKRLLLHCCCAVCSSWVVEYLSLYFNLTIYFNNSNIYPQKEFEKRLAELRRYIKEAGKGIEIITSEYDVTFQNAYLTAYKDEVEGHKRCEVCITARMKEAYSYSEKQDFDYFTTVMTISANKQSTMINQIGERLQAQFKPQYLYSDFKKNDGGLKTTALVEQYDIYRQNYCGCVFSWRKPENCSLDYLPGTDIYLFQRKDMFRINTDSALLGNFLSCDKEDIVLDVGCNNGALMLYAARHRYKELWGLDVLKEAIELADINLQLNKVENYRLFNCRIEDFQQQADVLVCNPPFFHDSHKENWTANKLWQTARHLPDKGLTGFISALKNSLKPQGRIYLVYRYDLWQEVESLFNQSGLFVAERQKVYEPRKARYQTVLLLLKSEKTENIKEYPDYILVPQYL